MSTVRQSADKQSNEKEILVQPPLCNQIHPVAAVSSLIIVVEYTFWRLLDSPINF